MSVTMHSHVSVIENAVKIAVNQPLFYIYFIDFLSIFKYLVEAQSTHVVKLNRSIIRCLMSALSILPQSERKT